MRIAKPRKFARNLHSHGLSRRRAANARRQESRADDGFTLLELLIVCVVTPIIIGSLAAGLIAVLSLQQGVTNRLSNSADSQIVEASYRNDVQSAQEVTTDGAQAPECGTGTEVLGLEWNLNPTTGSYQTVVSYVSVPVTSGATTTYELVRQACTNVLTPATNIEPVTSTTIISSNLAVNLAASELTPTVTTTASTNGDNTIASDGWVSATYVTDVTFPITEPQGSSTYSYTLVASPPTSNSSVDTGVPITSTTDAGCGYAAAGSGTYASSLCLVDFSALSANNGALMVAARQGCVELSVPLPGGSTMYFCIGITGAPVAPYALPTWTDGFLGNSINGEPFYSDVPGDAALYQSCEGSSGTCDVDGATVANTWGGVTTVTISNIDVVAPDGNPATGWEFVSADAESTDGGESITWTSNQNLYVIPNNEPSADTASDPIGNACNSATGVVPQSVLTPGTGSTTIECQGFSNGTKTGTLMVEAAEPNTMTIQMVGTGLEGISIGLLF
jgi:hypothetical protein